MRRLIRAYGAHPLHLLALLASFALAGYAAARLIPSRPVGVIVWFVGAAVGHDLLLLPLYSIVDLSLVRLGRGRAAGLPTAPWLNHLRVPLLLSGLLLLVFSPSIFQLSPIYRSTTDLSAGVYWQHWLAVTGGLFLVSAVCYALRLRRLHRQASQAS